MITVFILVPTKNSTHSAQNVLNSLIPMFGTLNCEQKEEVCALEISYVVSEEQQDKIIEAINAEGYEGLFITAPKDSANISRNQIIVCQSHEPKENGKM